MECSWCGAGPPSPLSGSCVECSQRYRHVRPVRETWGGLKIGDLTYWLIFVSLPALLLFYLYDLVC